MPAKKTPSAAPTQLQILTVDPATLTVRDQAREDATPDAELIASVRQHGIIQPPVVEPHEDGYAIVTGHRRVGAAIAAGMDAITVVVRDTPLDSEALTLEQQIVENERRRSLTAKDLATGYKKLSLFGLRPEDIAAGLGEKPAKVRAGLKITESKTAAELVEQEPAIDFEQAAIIAEFDAHPKLQRKLVETATTRPENFNRDVDWTRGEARLAERVAELKAQLDAEDTPVADVVVYESSWWNGKGVGTGKGRTLDRLGIPVDEHRDCPGHAAIIHRASTYYLGDSEHGIGVLYVCTDWQGNGHDEDSGTAREKTPEELEQEAEWERERAARAERQQLEQANTRARRTWIHGYLTTGRLRPTAAHFDLMAEALAAQIRWYENPEPAIVMELLTGQGAGDQARRDDAEQALADLVDDPATPNLRILVAVALATFEEAPARATGAKYFAFLEDQGYTLTDTDREHLTAAISALAAENADDAGEVDE